MENVRRLSALYCFNALFAGLVLQTSPTILSTAEARSVVAGARAPLD